MGLGDYVTGALDSVGKAIDDFVSPAGASNEESKVLSYPHTLANDSTVDFNDGMAMDESFGKDTKKFADSQGNLASDNGTEIPFILFEFLRIIPGEEKELTVSKLITKEESKDEVEKVAAEDDPILIAAAKNAGKYVKDTLDSWVPNRRIVKSIAMYMPPSMSISDSMSYDQTSRKSLDVMNSLLNGTGDLKEDAVTMSIQTAEFSVGAIGAGLGKLGGGIAGLGVGDIIKDEAQRIRGKVINPSEYSQFKSTGLRSFSFSWRMLPDSIQESNDVAEIVKFFRASAHPHKPSEHSITLHSPDQVVVTLHGVNHMNALPPVYITSINVTYNPNAASFFIENNAPVEVDLSISLQEVKPIYRNDILEKGY